MLTFLAIVHVSVCLILVGLVLIQDSKGGGVFNAQTSSNSFLGATGATTLAGNMTKVLAGVTAVTCILIAKYSAESKRSIVDTGMMGGTATSQPAIPTTTPAADTTSSTPAAEEAPKK
jgi:preprotein translocase subunit SecG